MKWIKVIDKEPCYNKYYIVGWFDSNKVFVSHIAYKTSKGWFDRFYTMIANPDYYASYNIPEIDQ